MKNSNSTDAYSCILNAIVKSELRPGDAVTEIQLAKKYGFGRTPVREAVMRLENEGFIKSTERKKRVYILFPKDIEEIFSIKQAIESMLSYQSSEKATESQKKELSNLLSQIRLLKKEENHNDAYVQKWLEYDREFHDIIFKIADNAKAEAIINNLNLQFIRIKLGMMVLEERVENSIREHTEIGEAILEGNSELASNLMHSHLENVKQTIIALMKTFYYNPH